MEERTLRIQNEVKKAISGKDHIIETVLTAILAGGHILLEDIPGVGKTTLALAMSKALGLRFNRVQFTPDVVPSDITGFSIFDSKTGEFNFKPGAVLTNFFLADEINRTSSKTQAALLQVMQEGRVTVDGRTYAVPEPFVVMATQNPVGTAGTQMLPEAQLDRFMVKIAMGYPDFDAQVDILKQRDKKDPLNDISRVVTPDEVSAMKNSVKEIYVDDKIYRYITNLAEETRKHPYVKLGVSPRGSLALANMAKANAFVEGRDFVTPEDVEHVLNDTWRHRLILLPKAGISGLDQDSILDEIKASVVAEKVNE